MQNVTEMLPKFKLKHWQTHEIDPKMQRISLRKQSKSPLNFTTSRKTLNFFNCCLQQAIRCLSCRLGILLLASYLLQLYPEREANIISDTTGTNRIHGFSDCYSEHNPQGRKKIPRAKIFFLSKKVFLFSFLWIRFSFTEQRAG